MDDVTILRLCLLHVTQWTLVSKVRSHRKTCVSSARCTQIKSGPSVNPCGTPYLPLEQEDAVVAPRGRDGSQGQRFNSDVVIKCEIRTT